MMYPVSERFLDALGGTHEAVCRARALPRLELFAIAPFGIDPLGIEIPVLSGDVRMTRTGDVKRTLDISVPGDYWDLLQPYAVELFVERGIDFGDGTQEYVPLGYYRVEDVEQDEAPNGPLRVSGRDRMASQIQNRVLNPFVVPNNTTHRRLFSRLVNGSRLSDGTGQSVEGYGMFINTPVPITFTGYNPDTARVNGGQTVEDSTYEFLATLANERGCALRFTDSGEMVVELIDGPAGAVPVFDVRGGPTGNLIKASRAVSRTGVYNIVSAYGSDPAAVTSYQLAYNLDWPLAWDGPFGPAPRYYASPLLRTGVEADAAAQTLLKQYVGLPRTLSLDIVPNPALRPVDLITADIGEGDEVHQINEYALPLTGTAPATITARTYVVAP